MSQAVRDDVADRLVKLKLKEMFGWKFLNADPHMGNFVYNSVTKKLGLLDYGSCKEMDSALAKGVARFMLACADGDRAAADAWFEAEGVVQEADEAAWGDQIFAYNAHLWQMFGSDAPFDFFAWYQDPKLQGFKQNVEYQNEAWSKQKVDEKQPNALMKPEILLITEYLMQIMLHCGRLKAKIPVRKYLLAAVEA